MTLTSLIEYQTQSNVLRLMFFVFLPFRRQLQNVRTKRQKIPAMNCALSLRFIFITAVVPQIMQSYSYLHLSDQYPHYLLRIHKKKYTHSTNTNLTVMYNLIYYIYLFELHAKVLACCR